MHSFFRCSVKPAALSLGMASIIGLISGSAYPLLGAPQPASAPEQAKVAESPAAGETKGQQAGGGSRSESLESVSDRFFAELFALEPSYATGSGIHKYDAEFEDFSSAKETQMVDFLKRYQAVFESIAPSSLSRGEQIDRLLLINEVRSRLLSLVDMHGWHNNPDMYSSHISSSTFNLIKRDFAPLPDRMRSVIARERAFPKVLKQGQENLKADLVSPISVDIALEQLPGIISFFKDSVPESFASVNDADLKKQLAETTAATLDALHAYEAFLKSELKGAHPATAAFAIGEENYRKKLAYNEMVDESIDGLIKKGEMELKRLQAEFKKTAKEIDANASAEEIFSGIAKEHPKPAELVNDTQGVLEKIRSFCHQERVVDIPGGDRPIVEETPPFMRALTFASLESPGPLETKAKETFYNVTLPESNWTAERTEQHMRFFSYPDLLNTSIHEVYPGHFVQFLWCRHAPSKTRKLIGCGSNSEGWAHYCEQMMLDEGYGGGSSKLRMVQLHDALLRACRYLVGIKMHTRNMSFDDGVNFFMTEGYQERANAERETKRGTMDPTYLVYTLGKMQILSLREEYKKMKGRDYSLLDFHDSYLKVGNPPVKLVRAELLGLPIPDNK